MRRTREHADGVQVGVVQRVGERRRPAGSPRLRPAAAQALSDHAAHGLAADAFDLQPHLLLPVRQQRAPAPARPAAPRPSAPGIAPAAPSRSFIRPPRGRGRRPRRCGPALRCDSGSTGMKRVVLKKRGSASPASGSPAASTSTSRSRASTRGSRPRAHHLDSARGYSSVWPITSRSVAERRRHASGIVPVQVAHHADVGQALVHPGARC